MKKIFASVLSIIFIISVIYEYNNIVYGGGNQNFDGSTSYEITTTQRQNSDDKDDNDNEKK